MKKKAIVLLAFVMMGVSLTARPVSETKIRTLCRSFVLANFEFTRQSEELSLVQTGLSDRGEACYYVFNVGETGFVIMSADDHYRPIIGYSYEGTFDVDNLPPALINYLDGIRKGVAKAAQASSAKASVTADWMMLEKTGRMVSRHGGRDDSYLVQTKWNQNYPYNYYCPSDQAGPGGRCYAGCVATAAAQVMRFWNHPEQGTGSYCYTHDTYGQLCANFGETTYDWSNMPNTINSSSPMARIQAIARLQHHAGISVNMNYSPSGSGAVTNRLTERMPAYFGYTNAMVVKERQDYSHEGYMEELINTFDMGWPIVHAGGGHAYVFDGYNDYDQIHANWGWSGSSDGWFDVDDHGYTDGQRGIFNFVPAKVYASTPAAPTDFVVTTTEGDALAANLTWVNPSVTLTGQDLTLINEIVVTRDGQTIFSQTNVQPGEAMTFVDETVPFYDTYNYAVYAVTEGQRGASSFAKNVLVLPSCKWRIIMQSTAFQGWRGGYVSLYSVNGREIQRLTINNSTPATIEFSIPVGRSSFGWTAPETVVSNMSVVIKDAEGNSVYSYTGSSSGMPEGVFLRVNNGCGNPAVTYAPYNLNSQMTNEGYLLTWESDVNPRYGFNIYRDEILYAMVSEGTGRSYVDQNYSQGHCYTVRALDAGGETEESNESCVSTGDCAGATNFDYEYVGNNYRIKLKWDKPESSQTISGYYLYRKTGEMGTYERIKLLGASALSFTDNTTSQEGDYYYRLYAYYRDTDCTSSPASVKGNANLFHLHVYYSPTHVEENNHLEDVRIFPNPANQTLNIVSTDMNRVTIFNVVGQKVYDMESNGGSMNVNLSTWNDGVYLVRIQTPSGQKTQQITVIH